MARNYRSSNVRFCLEDENQRRTWEYLQGLTRKDGSYGKVLSDAFVEVLDGRETKHRTEQATEDAGANAGETAEANSAQSLALDRDVIDALDVMEQMLEDALEKGLERLRGELREDLTGRTAETGTWGAEDAHRAPDVAEPKPLREMPPEMLDFAMGLAGE